MTIGSDILEYVLFANKLNLDCLPLFTLCYERVFCN